MKISFKSIIKTPYHLCKWWEQKQLLIQAGNTITLNPINKPCIHFVSLSAQNVQLFSFAASPNHQAIFVAEKVQLNDHQKEKVNKNNASEFCIQICSYSLQGERKAFRISQHPHYMPLSAIISIQLFAYELESSLVLVVTKSKSEVCVSLVDFLKLRLIASGFTGHFEQIKTFSQQTYGFSISGKGMMRLFRMQDGMWNLEEKLPKKLNNLDIIRHDWLSEQRIIMATTSTIYIIDSGQIIQTFTPISGSDSIIEIKKIGNSLIVITQRLQIYYYVEQNQQSNKFILEQQTNLSPESQYQKITQIEINKSGEQILIVLDNEQFYYSMIADLAAGSQQRRLSFEKIDLPCSKLTIGDVSTSNSKKFVLLSTETSVQIWDLKTFKLFNRLQINAPKTKQIRRCKLNPDGHSFCIAVADKLRFYQILINKFRNYVQFNCKNCIFIQYSHGGQLLAFGSGRSNNSILTIVNTIESKQVCNIKLGFSPVQAVWNQYDDELYVSGKQIKSISVYKISSKSKQTMLNFDEPVSYMRHDYSTHKLLVSVGQKIALLNSNYEISWIIPKICNFHYVFPIQGFYLAADKEGTLYYSSSIQFLKYKSVPIFIKQRFHLQYCKDTLIAYTNPSNCIAMKVHIPAQKQQTSIQKEGDIFLVEKQEINKFFDKVKLLENQLEQLQNVTSVKLDDERKKYNESLSQNSRNFQVEINGIAQRMQQLQLQRIKKNKESERVFEQLEVGQIRSVSELQKVYDVKIKLHKQRNLALEQQKTEQNMKFEILIKQLEFKYHNEIQKIRQEYSKKMRQGIRSSQSEKERAIQYKKRMEAKMIDLEEEQELTLFDMQISKDSQIKSLLQQNTKLEREYDSAMICLHNIEEEIRQLKEKYRQSNQKLKKNEIIVQENISNAKVLEKQIQKKNEIIDSKNAVIEQQQHQIEGLEKAKYVLGFRATQVRKQLQPKQGLIEKLKSELFKLDQDFKKEMKKNFELSQKMIKTETLCNATQKQKNQIKQALQHKQRLHDDMCLEMHILINNTDPNQWNSKIIKMYQQYVKQDGIANKAQNKKSDNTSEQINRHLIHVQKSLHQVATGNEKILKGKQMQIARKMKENAELVYDLNVMRKKQKEYIQEIQDKDLTISRLKREIYEVAQGNKSTRINTANTGFTRKLVSRDPSNSNRIKNNDIIDLSIIRKSDYLIPQREKKSRAFSAHKTLLWRDQTRKEKSKISDIAKQLQSAKNTIRRQDKMIQELNQRLLGLPEEQLM